MEELEQPKQDSLGSSESFGKFKDAESLLKAYTSLEGEFTRKSQRLAELEHEHEEQSREINKQADIDKRVEEFVTKYDFAMPFSSTLKESLANNENVSLAEETIRLMSNNYKRAEDYANDSEFLNNYIYSNAEIRDKIVRDYLSRVTQNTPIKVENSGNILLSTPRVPTTIQEAGRLAKSIIKQK